jgi:cobalt-zinc-cadmium efflux system outer membrane protein
MRDARTTLAVAAVLLGLTAGAHAQGPTIEPGSAGGAGTRLEPGLGPSPGALQGSTLGDPGGSDAATLSGAAGRLTGPVPRSVFETGGGQTGLRERPLAPPALVPAATLPVYGALSLPAEGEDLGPADGLTLDAAIERLVRANLELRAQFAEIPQAEADILTASLRANPILYADSQLVPYGQYSRERPGGQTQYDLNISLPLDINNKRQARMNVAGRAKQVLEAQYQNAVRVQIDNLYTAYVDGLAARETVRFASTSVEGLDQLLVPLRQRQEQKLIAAADVERVRVQRETAAVGLDESQALQRQSRHGLAALLNLPAAQAEGLELRGSIRDPFPPPPAADALIGLAMGGRPDLAAFRLGVMRASAEVQLARKNAFQDVYLLYQPYTLQDNTPLGLKSSHSWAVGVTVPLPILNRNQGNIQRARINVAQTQTELAALERAITAEVIRADSEYRTSRAAVERFEREVLPAARTVLESARLNFERGQQDVIFYLNARRDFNDVVRQYRDQLVRHRRSMLALNTAVGRRILP